MKKITTIITTIIMCISATTTVQAVFQEDTGNLSSLPLSNSNGTTIGNDFDDGPADIINGEEMKKDENRYLVEFTLVNDGEDDHFCGGSKIGPHVVLTAAREY